MQLTELGLNRNLIKENQSVETQDAVSTSANSFTSTNYVASGSAANDVNTGSILIAPSALNVSDLGWTQTCAFSVTSADTISWGPGIFTSAKGISYQISAGNTGSMSAKTYVYLDINVSTTSYQVTTSQTFVLSQGRVLIAVCQNGASAATYALVQASQITADNILVNSLSAISANLGSITAGSLNAVSITGSTITGSTLTTASSGQRVVLTQTLASFYNSNGVNTANIYGSTDSTTSILIEGVQNNSALIFKSGSSAPTVFYQGSTGIARIDNNGLYPLSSSTYDLGNISYKWRDIWNTGSQVYQGINQPVVYTGYVSGTSIYPTNTPGWGISNPGTGLWTITHNFGTTGYTVVATALRASGAGAYIAKVNNLSSNSFGITIFDYTGTNRDSDWMFTVCKLTYES